MAKFKRGTTIILEIEDFITDTSTLVDPATSMRITITDNNNKLEVDNQDMIKDSTGKYHYDYQSLVAGVAGKCEVIYTDTDGSRVSKGTDTFYLE